MAYAEKIESFGDTNWYLVDRKPYRGPSCNSRNIGKAILGYPSEEDLFRLNFIHYWLHPRPDTNSMQIWL